MKTRSFRILWVVIGILLVILGIVVLSNPSATLLGLSVLLGISMLVTGVLDIAAYFLMAGLPGSGWVLADGILTVLLSLLVFFNEAAAAVTIPVIFGMWLLFSGVSTAILAIDLKAGGINRWSWLFWIGFLMTGLGIFMLFQPAVAAITISILVGAALIAEGLLAIWRGFYSEWYVF